MLGIGQLLGDLVEALLAWFRVTREDGGSLSIEKRSGRGVHSFLAYLASGVDPVPGFERVVLLQVDLDGTVHLLHLLFSVPAGLYSTAWRLFTCRGELPNEGLPSMLELTLDAFRVWCSMRTVPRAEHVSHLEGVTPSVWHSMTYKSVGKAA